MNEVCNYFVILFPPPYANFQVVEKFNLQDLKLEIKFYTAAVTLRL